MPSLPTGPTQVTKMGNVGSFDVFRTTHLCTFSPRAQGVVNGLKKSAKNTGSQWYAQSAQCAHTGRGKGKCWFSWALLMRPNHSHLALGSRVLH